MATVITSECINCGACEPECPNTAIYQGGVEWQAPDGAMHPAISNDIFYIVPEKCTECVGFHDHEACAAVCPVDCCVPDPQIPETHEVLLERARALHPELTIADDAPSRFKKEGATAPAAGATPAPAPATKTAAPATKPPAPARARGVRGRAAGDRDAGQSAGSADQAARVLHLLSLRERLHDYLAARPAGVTAEELLDLVFVARGRDPDFGDRFLATLLGADARFRFEPVEQRWRVRACDGLVRPLAEVAFVGVDLATTGGAPGAGAIIA